MPGRIVDDEQRGDRPQSPCAQRVPAARRLASGPTRSAKGTTVLGTRSLLIPGQAP